jgi:ubiquinone/menaquinone biosynthesis C-methylase UbiE
MSDKKNGHVHHGKSTRGILDADRVVKTLGLKSGDKFLDAGSGDGYISFAASSVVCDEGKVYALDVYPESIDAVKKEVQERGVENLDAIIADLTGEIPLPDNSIDLCLMANVLHGFVENQETEDVMKEVIRVVKPGGILAIVEFKKEEIPGPPMEVRLAPEDVAEILARYNFRPVSSEEVGDFHYMVKGENEKLESG